MSEWIQAEDTENLICRLLSIDGRIEMGICPVLFGMRVRAGYVGSMCSQLDWCAGDRQDSLELLYALCRRIVGARLANASPFDRIPTHSLRKPWTLDTPFMFRLATLVRARGGATDPAPLPPIAELRAKYFRGQDPALLAMDERLNGGP